MTPEELNMIRAHMDDPTEKLNILTAQQDIKKLLAEVERLQQELQDITGAVPDPGGGDWVNGVYYDCKPCSECGETDQTHDFKCSKHPSNAPKPITDNQ